MFCPRCGKETAEDARFCENCGAKMEFIAHPIEPQKEQQKNMQPNVRMAMPPKMHKPISKLTVLIVAELAAILMLVVMLNVFYQKTYEKEYVAASFFVNMANGDYQLAASNFKYDDRTNHDFLDDESFEWANQKTSLGVITDYKICETDEEGLFQKREKNDKKNIDRDTVTIEYWLQGHEESDFYEVPVIEKAPNDKWAVMVEAFLCNDYTLYVPKDTTVTFDGKLLEDKQTTENVNEYDNNQDIYHIAQLYRGTHTIEVSMEGMETVTDMVTITYDEDRYYLDSLQLKKETVEQLIEKAGENLSLVYNSVLAGDDFSKVEDLFTDDEFIQEYYEELVSRWNGGSINMDKISFSNVSGYAENGNSNVSISFQYSMNYRYEDSWDNEIINEDYSDEDEMTMNFINEGGQWKQTNFPYSDIYY